MMSFFKNERTTPLSWCIPFIGLFSAELISRLSFIPRFIEKGNLEVKMFEVTSSLRMNHQKMYVAEEDHTVEEINKVC